MRWKGQITKMWTHGKNKLFDRRFGLIRESREHNLTKLPSATFSNGLPKDLFAQFAQQVAFGEHA